MTDLSVVFMPHPPIIIPAIGGGREKDAEKTIEAMDKLGQLVKQKKPNTIVYITPHGNSFHNGTCILYGESLHGDFKDFGFPEIHFQKKVNQTLASQIYEAFESDDFISVLMNDELSKQYKVKISLDHGVMVPMYFIDKYYKDYDMVHITPGFTPLEENYYLGKCIQYVVKDINKSVLVVCSGDLSHALKDDGPYAFHPMGAIFDQKVKEAITDLNPMSLLSLDDKIVEEAGQCGLRSFLMGFGFLDGMGFESEVISYEGPFGVGYLTGYLKLNQNIKNPSLLKKIKNQKLKTYEEKIAKEDDFIKLARKSIETYIKHNIKLDFEKVKEEFSKEFIMKTINRRAGAFVSIHSHSNLRGCIGTILSMRDSLIDEIIYNSISACSNDPRFNPVQSSELLELDVKVDILGEPELIHSKDELDVIKYGIIVEKDIKRGLLLPNLEGVNTIDEQVEIAMKKAQIKNMEGMKIYRFQVERHE